MEEHLSQIRAAFAAPSDSSKQAALRACQALRTAIEGLISPGAPSAAGTQSSSSPEPAPQHEPAPELCDTSEAPLSRETLEEAATPKSAPAPVVSPDLPSVIPGVDPAAIAALVTTLRSLTPDQWLDLIISKLRAAVGTNDIQRTAPKAAAPPAAPGLAQPSPIRFQLVPIPSSRPLGGKPSR